MTLSIHSRRSKMDVDISPVLGKDLENNVNVSADPKTGIWCQFQNSIDGGKWPSKKTICLLALTATIALGASGYLAWVAFTSSKVAGCGGGRLFNCGHVISSRWSLWLGIPVSVLAAGLYLSLVAALCFASMQRFSESTRRNSWFIVSVLALSAGMAALWFVGLQFFALGHLCTYCLLAHGCGLVAATTVLLTRPNGLVGLKIATPIAITGLVVLAGFQIAADDPATYKIETFDRPATQVPAEEFDAPVAESLNAVDNQLSSRSFGGSSKIFQLVSLSRFARSPSRCSIAILMLPQQDSKNTLRDQEKQPEQSATKTRRFVSFQGGTAKLDVARWPVAGSTDAKYIFIEMFDYSCPHCRKTHLAIKGASKALGGDVAVIALPIPLNAGCNDAVQVTDPSFNESCEISKLAVAVWRVNPAKFSEFHHGMFSTASPPTYAQAKEMADTMVDTDKLNKELASDIPTKYIAQHVELYKRAGSGNVPKLIFPSTSIVGEFTSSDGLVEIIQQQLK